LARQRTRKRKAPRTKRATRKVESGAVRRARRAALDVLGDVLRRKHAFDEAFAERADAAGLEARDRAFVHNLCATALRRLGQIDDVISAYIERQLPRSATAVHDILRLGATQLLFLGTPAHAAVNESVELAAAHDLGGFKGLVNAVLRRIADEGPARLKAQDAARINTRTWLWDSWCSAYGEARARRIAEAHLAEAPLDITVRKDATEWAAKLDAEVLPTGSLRRKAGGQVPDLPGFAAGAWWVQDAAAALPARLFGNLSGKIVFDLCAAPGGKTAQLAALGAKVYAVDSSTPRLRRLEENLARLWFTAEIVAIDASVWAPDVLADGVLLDPPCTATGTIRRHPDIPHLKSPANMAALIALQNRLLGNAAELAKPGGLLVYCTCSLQADESEARIAEFLAARADYERVPIAASELGIPAEAITAAGEVRTTPAEGFDGFYIARLRRREG
jgi:16S rRNA (cytosine967-C5)-methyltransferase